MHDSPEELRARILGEVLDACERGDTAPLERACTEHPELAAELRSAARVVLDLRSLAGDADSLPEVPIIGSRIGRFVVLSEIGRGGMGIVLRARDESLGREVALKLIASPLAPSSEAMARFQSEARALARLRHPHVVSILEVVETPSGWPCFAMDLVEGEGLDRILTRLAGLDPATLDALDLHRGGDFVRGETYFRAVASLGAKVADALACAHAAGVIHRDVKPGNVLIDRAGEPRLVDFGLARDLNASSQTRTGRGLGTPIYMAPEQIDGRGRSVDARTDVYALGATLYEAITLRRPFHAETSQETFRLVLERDPALPRALHLGIPRDLETICLKAMEKSPDRRYDDAASLAADLRAFLDGQPISAHPSGPVTRAMQRVRRNPWPAVACVAVPLAVIGLVATWARPRLQRNEQVVLSHSRLEDALTQYRDLEKQCAEITSRVVDIEMRQNRNEITWKEKVERVEAEEDLLEIARQASVNASDALREALKRAEFTVEHDASLFQPCAEAHLALWEPLAREEFLRDTALAPLQHESSSSSERDRKDARQLLEQWRRARPEDSAAIQRYEEALRGRAKLAFDPLPPGVALYLFRFDPQQRGNSPTPRNRLVPVPIATDSMESPIATPWTRTARRYLFPGDVVLQVTSVEPDSPGSEIGLRAGDLIAAFPGFPPEGRAYVRAVEPGGPAAAAGVEPWDVLASISDSSEPPEADLHAFIDFARRDVQRPVVFTSDDKPRRVEWSPREKSVPCHRIDSFERDLGVEIAGAEDLIASAPPERGAEIEWLSADGPRTASLRGGVPTGVTARLTASPLWCSRANLLGVTPLATREIPPGKYLVVVRRADGDDVSVPLFIGPSSSVSLPREAATSPKGPDGFVYVSPGPYLSDGDPVVTHAGPLRSRDLEGFWFARTETSTRDYMEFLNHRETKGEIVDCSSRREITMRDLARVPRDVMDPKGPAKIYGKKGLDGRYTVEWDCDLPIHGVSFDDAVAYCEWRTRRARSRGEPWVFELPTSFEFEKAARGVDGRHFPWGNGWETTFPKGRFENARFDALAELRPARIGRYLFDESPFGARDCSGNVLEWCTTFGPRPGHRIWRSGNCDDRGYYCMFRAASFEDGRHDNPGIHDGFRVVARWAPQR